MKLFDTSVIIDAREVKSPWHQWAREQIAEAGSTEGAALNTVALAEASVRVDQRDKFPERLEQMGITLVPLPISAAVPAAKAFAQYLNRLEAEGKKRDSKIPLGDFLIGAHAQAEGLTLVTRDPDRVKTYFPTVKMITP
ncbi:MAG: type II toxin-antitoxin system VapC family toxin [Verrucomicrobiota bacterium]|nr:type II toxin-antitoxin system VapC family toxin [Verrucomicrobiota bacterium]